MSWYEDWFGADYLELYAHRDEAEARSQVQFVIDHLQLNPAIRLLDIACGSGRHVRAFRERGLSAVGIDLSLHLLRSAHERNTDHVLIRSDMRTLPFATATFDVLTSFFTSFGYFADDLTQQQTLLEWSRVLRAGGTLFLDHIDKSHALENLIPNTDEVKNNVRVIQRRSLSTDGKRLEKTIEIWRPQAEVPAVYRESVRVYTSEELCELLRSTGFSPEQAPLLQDGRLLVFARRTA